VINWSEIKQQARDAVHDTFSVDGLYTDLVVTDVPIKVRLHRKSAFIGDAYESDFSPGLFSEINRVIVDLREVSPKHGGQITIPDFGGVEVTIENVQHQGENKALCEVRV
jgi:hypothetical protein